ncbi:unnamed protein product [Brassicogethes aeneus]|uniref:BED-type domain-containing protein n=1 Tax=Brassicogethes aeneus TaxID=1431903 RepID=A0A9P0BJ55_BRAAE|nr:unnamed protein product [Brassicogethes aeneus]
MCKTPMSYKTTVSNLKKHLIKRHPMVQLVHENVDRTNDPPFNDNVPAESTSTIEVVPAKLTTTPSQVDLEALASIATTSRSHSNMNEEEMEKMLLQYEFMALRPG